MEEMKRTKRVTETTAAAKADIIKNSVQGLSNQPALSAAEMKKKFVDPIVNGDGKPSAISESDRIAREAEAAIEEVLTIARAAIGVIEKAAEDNKKAIGNTNTALGLKQDKTDASLKTTAKTVPGAINELKQKTDNDLSKVTRNGQFVSLFKADELLKEANQYTDKALAKSEVTKIVTSLPAVGIENVLYLLVTGSDNVFSKYIWTHVTTETGTALGWKLLGEVKIEGDLSRYVEKIEYDKNTKGVEGSDGTYVGLLYGVKYNGQQLPFPVTTQAHEYTIPIRNHNGNFYVKSVELDYECTNKKFVVALVSTKFDKTGGIISGDVAVQGNMSVTGTTTTKDTETVYVKENVIVANSDGIDLIEEAGFAIKTSTTAAYGILYDPVGNGVKIGLGYFDENGKFIYEEGEAQFLATREDSMTDGNIPKWDAARNMFVDSGKHADEVIYELTDEDKEEIATLVAIKIKEENVIGIPDENMNILLSGILANGTYTLRYINEDGTLSDPVTMVVGSAEPDEPDTPTYVNQIPISTDESGNLFIGDSGEAGYKTGYRLSLSGGGETVTDGYECTGFIPITQNDVIRIKDIDISEENATNIICYDINKQPIAVNELNYGTTLYGLFVTYGTESNDVYTSKLSNVPFLTNLENVAYIRIGSQSITADSILTINEEIV